MGELTSKAAQFVARNTTCAIVAGEALTSRRRRIFTAEDHKDRTYLRYRFASRSTMLLNQADLDSLHAAKYEPRWTEPTTPRAGQEG